MKDMLGNEETEVMDESTEESIPYRYTVTSYGADYPVDSIVGRLERKVIYVPPFQRGYIWPLAKASRFIESLLLGLPVPGIFLSRDPDSSRMLIIDGQQRLKTLQYFYEGIFQGREFKLHNVEERYEGRTYRTLEPDDRQVLDDSIIHATIVKQDEPSDDQSSIFHVFERLNTGSMLLQPQEIRACIFYGPFNKLLDELNNCEVWRDIYGKPSPRLKDQELLLRFFALFFKLSSYERPMKEFLNKFMGANKYLKKYDRETLTATFDETIGIVGQVLGNRAFRPERVLNAAVFDSVMVGLATRISKSTVKHKCDLKASYRELMVNEEYMNVCKTATSDKKNVLRRVSLATQAFDHIT